MGCSSSSISRGINNNNPCRVVHSLLLLLAFLTFFFSSLSLSLSLSHLLTTAYCCTTTILQASLDVCTSLIRGSKSVNSHFFLSLSLFLYAISWKLLPAQTRKTNTHIGTQVHASFEGEKREILSEIICYSKNKIDYDVQSQGKDRSR